MAIDWLDLGAKILGFGKDALEFIEKNPSTLEILKQLIWEHPDWPMEDVKELWLMEVNANSPNINTPSGSVYWDVDEETGKRTATQQYTPQIQALFESLVQNAGAPIETYQNPQRMGETYLGQMMGQPDFKRPVFKKPGVDIPDFDYGTFTPPGGGRAQPEDPADVTIDDQEQNRGGQSNNYPYPDNDPGGDQFEQWMDQIRNNQDFREWQQREGLTDDQARQQLEQQGFSLFSPETWLKMLPGLRDLSEAQLTQLENDVFNKKGLKAGLSILGQFVPGLGLASAGFGLYDYATEKYLDWLKQQRLNPNTPWPDEYGNPWPSDPDPVGPAITDGQQYWDSIIDPTLNPLPDNRYTISNPFGNAWREVSGNGRTARFFDYTGQKGGGTSALKYLYPIADDD